jgi:hypothetical protein
MHGNLHPKIDVNKKPPSLQLSVVLLPPFWRALSMDQDNAEYSRNGIRRNGFMCVQTGFKKIPDECWDFFLRNDVKPATQRLFMLICRKKDHEHLTRRQIQKDARITTKQIKQAEADLVAFGMIDIEDFKVPGTPHTHRLHIIRDPHLWQMPPYVHCGDPSPRWKKSIVETHLHDDVETHLHDDVETHLHDDVETHLHALLSKKEEELGRENTDPQSAGDLSKPATPQLQASPSAGCDIFDAEYMPPWEGENETPKTALEGEEKIQALAICGEGGSIATESNLALSESIPEEEETPKRKAGKERKAKRHIYSDDDMLIATEWSRYAKREMPSCKIVIEKWADEVRLIRAQFQLSKEDMLAILLFVANSTFWRPNAVSILGLRSESKANGLRKIENIMKAMKGFQRQAQYNRYMEGDFKLETDPTANLTEDQKMDLFDEWLREERAKAANAETLAFNFTEELDI